MIVPTILLFCVLFGTALPFNLIITYITDIKCFGECCQFNFAVHTSAVVGFAHANAD